MACVKLSWLASLESPRVELLHCLCQFQDTRLGMCMYTKSRVLELAFKDSIRDSVFPSFNSEIAIFDEYFLLLAH